MDNRIWQAATDVEYQILDRGFGAWAIKPGPAAVDPIPAVPGSTTVSEDFEGTPWSTITFGGGTWALATDESHSPTHSFKSAAIGDNDSTQFTMFNDTFDPQISMWVKTNTESGFDFFTIKVDSVIVYQESGDNDWHRIAIPLNFGYQIDVIYSKDFSGAPVGDACWVDDIVFGGLDTPAVPGSPAHPFVYTPLKMTDDGERLKVDSTVTGTVTVAEPVDVNVVSSVELEIKNDVGNPVPVSGTVDIGTMPEVEIKNDVGNPVPVTGTVTITDGSGPVTVDGTVTANQGTSPWVVSGTVNIGTMPEVEIKNDSGNPIPVTTDVVTGTLSNGAETSVAGSAVQVLAANSSRRKLIVQNTGIGNVRIGVTGVAATTGFRLTPSGTAVFDMPNCPTQAIFAIREGAVSSTVLAQEIT